MTLKTINVLKATFLATIFVASVYAFAAEEGLNSQFTLAETILTDFPPHEFDYLFIGRSGAAIQVAMEEILAGRSHKAVVEEFPLSGLRSNSFGIFGDGSLDVNWYDKNFNRHLKSYFPSPTASKKILLIDYVSSGQTAQGILNLMDMAEERDWITREVHFLGIMGPSISKKRVTRNRKRKNTALLSRFYEFKVSQPLARLFSESAFKAFSQYESWDFRNRDYEEDQKSYRVLKQKPPRMPRYSRPRLNRSWPFQRESSARKELRALYKAMAEGGFCSSQLIDRSS